MMAAAGFRLKQIAPRQRSLGDRLKAARQIKGVNVSQAEESTHIRAKFILALESDAWEQLPSEVYGRGYLFKYADYLGLSRQVITAEYERQRALLSHRCKEADASSFTPQQKVTMPRFYITTRLLSYVASATIVLVLGGYLVFQVNKFSSVPLLSIASPVSAQSSDALSGLVIEGSSITVTGQTTVGATVTVNDHNVMVDGSGNFTATIELAKGENLIQIKAVNRSKATRQETLRVIAHY